MILVCDDCIIDGMAEQNGERKFLIIPTDAELADAWNQNRSLIERRNQRGDVTIADGGQQRVSSFPNVDQILADNPHIKDGIDFVGETVAKNVQEGRLSPDDAFKLGAKFIIEMFAIATTAQQIEQIEGEL